MSKKRWSLSPKEEKHDGGDAMPQPKAPMSLNEKLDHVKASVEILAQTLRYIDNMLHNKDSASNGELEHTLYTPNDKIDSMMKTAEEANGIANAIKSHILGD